MEFWVKVCLAALVGLLLASSYMAGQEKAYGTYIDERESPIGDSIREDGRGLAPMGEYENKNSYTVTFYDLS